MRGFLLPAGLLILSLRGFADPTPKSVNGSNYWTATSRFIGSAQCALCHANQAKHFHDNSMSRALFQIDKTPVMQGDVHFTWTDGKYSYLIHRDGGKVLYRVTDGKEVFETPLLYAFGQGMAGQTYVFAIDGQFFESRVSYYTRLKALDLTIGAVDIKPDSLQTASGRVMFKAEARECFGCHTTGARLGNTLQLVKYEDGVQCESCHGPGGAHVDSIHDGKPAPDSIRSLKGLDPQQTNELCGTCHRTWETVVMMGVKGINSARFPPYRITNSACFSLVDSRISCTTCHNPHEGLVRDDKYYDSKCTACHNVHNAAIKKQMCPVGKEACTSCHMQRVEPPDAHHAFPDHWFRVVKAGAPYPN